MKATSYKEIFGIGPFGALLSFALLLVAWYLDRILSHPQLCSNSGIMRIPAAFLIAVGLGLHLWAFRTLGNWWTEDQLCTKGPFKYFRHPMYAAWITFIALGISLVVNSWIFLLWYASLQAIWHRLVVKDETMLTDTFGEEYQMYMKRTSRFIPKMF